MSNVLVFHHFSVVVVDVIVNDLKKISTNVSWECHGNNALRGSSSHIANAQVLRRSQCCYPLCRTAACCVDDECENIGSNLGFPVRFPLWANIGASRLSSSRCGWQATHGGSTLFVGSILCAFGATNSRASHVGVYNHTLKKVSVSNPVPKTRLKDTD